MFKWHVIYKRRTWFPVPFTCLNAKLFLDPFVMVHGPTKLRVYCSLMDEHAMCDVDDLLLRLLLGLAGLTSLLPSWTSNLFWIKYQIEIHGSMNKYQNLFCWQRNFQPCQLFLSSSLLFWPWHKLKSADNRCNTNFAISQTWMSCKLKWFGLLCKETMIHATFHFRS